MHNAQVSLKRVFRAKMPQKKYYGFGTRGGGAPVLWPSLVS